MKDVPAFRVKALEEEFCKNLTRICVVLSQYGGLEDIFDIQQMMNIQRQDNLRDVVPFAHHLTPLTNSLNEVQQTLLEMDRLGPLRIKYTIEDNKLLQDGVAKMIQCDRVVQLLLGDELKQD